MSARSPGVLGIDPGFSGGLAFTLLDGTSTAAIPMPVIKGAGRTEIDVPALVAFILGLEDDGGEIRLVVIERVHSMPAQGVASTFSFGLATGEVRGVVKTLGYALEQPLPQAWKKVVLAGTDGDKLAAIQYVRRRFPDVSLLASPRCTKPHDGMADAICLAEWGRRQLVGREPAGKKKKKKSRPHKDENA